MLRQAFSQPDYSAALNRKRHAEDALTARLIARARQSAFRELKNSARRYILCPANLDGICDGLSRLPPGAMLEAAKIALRYESETPLRFMGLGPNMPLMNARAACIYARLLRARHRKYFNINRHA